MTNKIDHIGVAVRDLDAQIEFYKNVLGLTCTCVEEVKEQKVRVAILPIGDTKIELLAPTSTESPVAKFMAKNGEGLHHIAFRVTSIEKALEKVKANCVKLIDEKPRIGAAGLKIAFLHPKSTGGILIELCQKDEIGSE
jgi:methylmalonyl-CoA epimerase